MKELDAVGDAHEGRGGRGARARGNRCCNEDEHPGSFTLVKLIPIHAALTRAHRRLPVPVNGGSSAECEQHGGQLVNNLEQMKGPPVCDTLEQMSHMALMEIITTPSVEKQRETTSGGSLVGNRDVDIKAANWNWICR